MEMACLDLINSEFRDFRGRWVRDDLQQTGWLEQYLARWSLQLETLPDSDTLAAFVELRILLRRMVEKLAKGHLSASDLDALNAYLLKSPSSCRLMRNGEEYRLELVSMTKDWNWVLAEIIASFAELLVNYEAFRIKICENPNCRWIFYDESRSHTRRFCTSNKCANLLKMRRFRARHRENA